MITESPEISRRELSRKICEWRGWYSPNGKLQEMSCRKALLELERQGKIRLPEIKQRYSFKQRSCRSSNLEVNELEIAQIRCSLSELGEVKIEPIDSRYSKDSKAWFTLVNKYHYLGNRGICGSQIRYIVKSPKYGYIGAISFSSSSWQSKARDEYIGWSEWERSKNIRRVINNGRLLIVPTVEVRNLGSYILSRTISRISEDWEKRYKIEPKLIETYVDPSRYRGTIYKASNWRYIGQTSGRRDGISKDIYVYELSKDWKEELCREGSRDEDIGEIPSIDETGSWTEAEFGRVRIYDRRIKRRLNKIAESFYENSQSNIPEACGSKAATIGAYRFFQNPKVTMEVILDSHRESTIERIKERKVVLAVQDTTFLNYSTHPMTEGMGPINNKEDESIGLILHDTMAFSPEGTPLGILDAQCWARDESEQGKRYKRKELSIEQKESIKWIRSFQRVREIQRLCPQTKLVSIGDRESDIYELFDEAVKGELEPKLLVRAERSRNRRTRNDSGAEEEYIWEYMQRQQSMGRLEIHIPRKSNRKSRVAEVELRYSKLELLPPKRLQGSRTIKVWGVYLHEQADEAAAESRPIEWMLITTAEVKDFTEAKEIVDWYVRRWGIEVYHRTLKSGCRIEDRQLGTADTIEASLGIDMVVAWRIFHMTMLGRELPNSPCTIFFKEEEWKALYCYANKTPKAPKEPPSMAAAVKMLGSIGGHLGRKSDGMPGTETLWRGLERLETATEMYIILTKPPPDDDT